MLVTGKMLSGKFQHKLFREVADLLKDLEPVLRKHGGSAAHFAHLLELPGGAEQTRPEHREDLKWLAYHLYGVYTHGVELHRWLHVLVSHAEGVKEYEIDDGGCKTCKLNAGHWEPRDFKFNSRYCRRCRNFRSRHGVDPPLAILEFWHRGGQIVTNSMLIEHGVIKPDPVD